MAEAVNTIANVINTVEAIRRLVVDISDQEVEDSEFQLFTKQFDALNEAMSKEAMPVWKKRELAFELLSAAICDGEIPVGVCAANGAFIPIAGSQLCHAAFLRDIILGGKILAGGMTSSDLEQHHGEWLWLSTTVFKAWLQERRPRPESVETAPPSSTAATSSECSPLTAPSPPTVVTTPEDMVKSDGGRPSSLPIILVEAERRLRNGETKAHFVNHFAKELVAWFKELQKEHSSLPDVSVKTLQNSLDFGSLWMRRDELHAR